MKEEVFDFAADVKITDDAALAKAKRAAALFEQADKLDDDRKEANAEANAQISALQSEAHALLKAARSGIESRTFKAVERICEEDGTLVEIVSTETGKVLDTRAATDHDRQLDLGGVPNDEGGIDVDLDSDPEPDPENLAPGDTLPGSLVKAFDQVLESGDYSHSELLTLWDRHCEEAGQQPRNGRKWRTKLHAIDAVRDLLEQVDDARKGGA